MMHDYGKKLYSRSSEIMSFKNGIIKSYDFIGKDILDIGCATGIFDESLVHQNNIWGIDRDSVSLSSCEKKGYQTVLHDFGQSTSLPFDSNFFDVIIAFDIIEHLQDPSRFLSEIYRVLKPEGLFFAGVPNGFNIINRIIFALGISYDVTDMAHFENELFSDHLHQFTLKKFESFLNRGSFIINRKDYYLQRKIRHSFFKMFKPVLFLLYLFKMHFRWPSLFSFFFLFSCSKKKVI